MATKRGPLLGGVVTHLLVCVFLLGVQHTSGDPGPTSNSQGGLYPPFPEGQAHDGTRFKTAYSCEGENMTITCNDRGSNPREMIQVVRGNFGRFTIALCNQHGQTDWSVNCMAPSTTITLKQRCDGRRACTIPVSSSVLPDACPGTHKYLEIHYACSTSKAPVVVNSNEHRPPWLQKGRNTPDHRKTWKPTLVGGGRSSVLGGRPSQPQTDNDRVVIPVTTQAPRKPILVTDKEDETPRVPITTPIPSTSSLGPVGVVRPPHPDRDHLLDPIKSQTDKVVDLQPMEDNPQPPQSNEMASVDGFNPSSGSRDDNFAVVQPSSSSSINMAKQQEGDNSLFVGPSSTSGSSNPSFWCAPTTARKLQWDWTQAGKEIVQPCPIGATGHARWSCLLVEIHGRNETPEMTSTWAPPQPDMSNCKSMAMTKLEAQVRKEDPENLLVSALAYLTRTKSLYGGDLETAVATMRTVANRIQYRLQQPVKNGGLPNKESHIRQVLENVFRSANNVLDPINREAWFDLNPDGQMKVASQLTLSLNENAFLLAKVMNDPNSVVESSDILTMAVSVVDVTNRGQFTEERNRRKSLTFPARTSNLLYVDDSVQISFGDVQNHAQGGLSEVVFFSFNNLHEILGHAKMEVEDHKAHRDRVLNSRIISASLSQPGQGIQLAEPVKITFRHLSENMTDAVCVYWDLDEHSWSSQGCRVKSSNKTQTVCECDHLTNFAVSMRPLIPGDESEVLLESILNRIDIIGSVVAAIFVFCLVLILLVCRHKMCGSSSTGFCCCCCGLLPMSSASFCSKDPSANHKGQSYYHPGPGGHHSGSNLEASSKSSRSLLLNNSSRMSSQYAGGTKTLQHGVVGTVRVTPNGTATTLLPQPHHLNKPRPHITLNPYSTQLVDSINMMMPSGSTGSSSLDSGVMSPQFMTQNLSRGGVSSQDELVYRAVSPHGHVYWEIDPSNPLLMHHQQQASQLYEEAIPHPPQSDLSDQSLEDRLSYSRQSSSRFSEQRPLISSPLQQPLLASVSRAGSQGGSTTLRPSASNEQFVGRISGPSSQGISSTFVRTGAHRFNSRNRTKSNKDETASNVPEQLQTQVQIKDCKPIQVSVKSSEYIEAKIRTLRRNNNNNNNSNHFGGPGQNIA
ncbi:latrophilin Cirl-like [Tigriopus californicus]|nr:latrophilin Cirl-like [Tigriopus californicus]